LYAIIAEDKSDVETLTALIRLIAGSQSISIKGKGYGGCAEMLRKGARQIQAFHDTGSCQRFVVCYDSDKASPDVRRQELIDKVIVPSNVIAPMCALIPIQEIEAWILADIKAVTKIITGWVPDKYVENPEGIVDPKEYLEKMSRQNQRPRYSHAVHNAKIARHLDLDQVRNKCPSFLPLYEIVKRGVGNV
jgi:Domain of unknown function (DUF4276)